MPPETIDNPAAYVTIRVTSDVLDRLRDKQTEFNASTGGTITQSAIIRKGLDLIDSTGTLVAQSDPA